RDRGHALPAARPQREAAPAPVGRAQARHARRLAPVRHGRLEAGKEARAERPDHLLLDHSGAQEMKIEIVSDVICPWCYIGKRRLEKAFSLINVSPEISWLP